MGLPCCGSISVFLPPKNRIFSPAGSGDGGVNFQRFTLQGMSMMRISGLYVNTVYVNAVHQNSIRWHMQK